MPCDGKNSNCQRRRELLSQLKCLISSMDRKKPCEWDEPPCPPPTFCPVPKQVNTQCYNPAKPCNSCELRSSTMWRCNCIKRNGLQDRCMLVDCLGRPECMTKLYPICGPGKKALLKLTDLGDEEVALRKFHSADKARESALAAYCRLKCGINNPGPTNNCPPSPSLSSNCPLSNSPPNCPSNPPARNYPSSSFPSSNCPLSNSPPSNCPSFNPPPPNCPSFNPPPPNCPSSNSPPPNCPLFNPSSRNYPSPNFPSPNFPSPNYPPPSYSQSSNNCPPPYNSLSSNYRVTSSPLPASSFQPQSFKPQMQSCPQQQSQNQNFSTSPQACATCMSH